MSNHNSVEGLLSVAVELFKAGVKAEILKKLQEDMAPQLEAIATAEAQRVSDVVINYWKDERMMVDWMHWRIKINGVEVERAAS